MGSQSSMSKVIEALDYFGIAHSSKMVYRVKENTKFPKCCIVNTKGHLVVFYDRKYYDSYTGILNEFDFNEITGYLEILTDGFSNYEHLLLGVLPNQLKAMSADSNVITKRFLQACIGWIRYKPLLLYITQRDS